MVAVVAVIAEDMRVGGLPTANILPKCVVGHRAERVRRDSARDSAALALAFLGRPSALTALLVSASAIRPARILAAISAFIIASCGMSD